MAESAGGGERAGRGWPAGTRWIYRRRVGGRVKEPRSEYLISLAGLDTFEPIVVGDPGFCRTGHVWRLWRVLWLHVCGVCGLVWRW
jgi:hypothetical protein